MEKPDAAACARNREPILEVLRDHFADRRKVLEIGSGTGQHAIFFAAELPHLAWQASDRAENLPGIEAWLDDAALPNTPAPIPLDVNDAWPATRFDAVFSSNEVESPNNNFAFDSSFDELISRLTVLPRSAVMLPLSFC